MPAAHISHLPQEISDIIVDDLASDIYFDEHNVFIGQEAVRKPTKEITTFQHYSLISRQFTARVQKHLFHGFLHDALKHITVDEGILFNAGFLKILNNRQANCPASPLTLRVFADFREYRPIYYQDFIKARSNPESLCGLQAVETLHCGYGTLGEFIRDFHSVKTLDLDGVSFPRGQPVNDVGSPWLFPHLTKLVLNSVSIAFMTGCVNLETLVVDYANIGEGSPPDDEFDDSAEFADMYLQDICTVLHTCRETLESFHIGALLTSAFGEERQYFNLHAVTKLSSLIMDFEVSDDTDTSVYYILDTIRTLDPKSVDQGIIEIKIHFYGDAKDMLVEVFEQDEWLDIKQELIRLSEIAPTALNVHVDIGPDDEEYQNCLEAIEEWRLSVPDMYKVSVHVEMKALPREDYQL